MNCNYLPISLQVTHVVFCWYYKGKQRSTIKHQGFQDTFVPVAQGVLTGLKRLLPLTHRYWLQKLPSGIILRPNQKKTNLTQQLFRMEHHKGTIKCILPSTTQQHRKLYKSQNLGQIPNKIMRSLSVLATISGMRHM